MAVTQDGHCPQTDLQEMYSRVAVLIRSGAVILSPSKLGKKWDELSLRLSRHRTFPKTVKIRCSNPATGMDYSQIPRQGSG